MTKMTKKRAREIVAREADSIYPGIAPDLISSLADCGEELTLAGAVDTICDKLSDLATYGSRRLGEEPNDGEVEFRAAWALLDYKGHRSAARAGLRGYFGVSR